MAVIGSVEKDRSHQPTASTDCIGDTRLTPEERAFTHCRSTVMNDRFDDHRAGAGRAVW